MTIVNIRAAKRRFGLKPRKQWKFEITAANGEPLHPNDSYANTGDIITMLHTLREDEMVIHIHYEKGVETITLPANPPRPF